MIIYNVTIKIDTAIENDWVSWMKEKHIPNVMKTGFFVDHRICRVLLDEVDGSTFAIQYTCKNMKTLQQYQQEHAPRLQKEHTERYKNRFVAFRTLLEPI